MCQSLSSALLWRQCLHASDATSGPLREALIGGYPFRRDVDKAAHRPARHVEWPGVRLRQRIIQVFLTNANHQFIARHAKGHIAVQNETQAAKHLLLADSGASGQQRPNTVCQFFVVGHLEHHHGAQHLALLHLVESLLNVADPDGLRDEAVQVETPLHV